MFEFEDFQEQSNLSNLFFVHHSGRMKTLFLLFVACIALAFGATSKKQTTGVVS